MVLVFGFSFCLREGFGVFVPPLNCVGFQGYEPLESNSSHPQSKGSKTCIRFALKCPLRHDRTTAVVRHLRSFVV